MRICAPAQCVRDRRDDCRLAPGVVARDRSDVVTGLARWLGTVAAIAVLGAALATADRSRFALWVYRIALFRVAALVAVAAHLGGLLVWGADFLRT